MCRHTATELYICSYHLSADCPGLILRGLSVSTSDEQLALTTEKGQLLLCDLSSAAVAAATAAADPGAGLDESSRDALAEADQVLSTGLAAAAGSSGEDLVSVACLPVLRLQNLATAPYLGPLPA